MPKVNIKQAGRKKINGKGHKGAEGCTEFVENIVPKSTISAKNSPSELASFHPKYDSYSTRTMTNLFTYAMTMNSADIMMPWPL